MESSTPTQLKTLDQFSDLLDSKFRIPGTDIRFGLDFLIGLIPIGGDIISFMLSGGLVLTMAKHGASGFLIARMLLNIVLDTVIGSIPVIGDIFDLFYKSNRRNYNLLRDHYVEGDSTGSAWKVVIPVLLVLVFLLILTVWLAIKLVGFFWNSVIGIL